MKKHYLLQLLFAVLAMATIVSCDDDEDNNGSNNGGGEGSETEITANISEDVTWESGKVYVLKQRVTVLDGVKLTIEPGTIIKGDADLSGAQAAVLMVAQGGYIDAQGTADEPIIFTTTEDEIEPGETVSSGIAAGAKGLWGGVVILGKAPISPKTGGATAQIEGVDANDQNGLYGGDNAADNSGILKYVSIRYGGAEIAEGSEINGLTLGGVGNKTVIENIEVVGNSDDGVEFFGGSVNVTNLVVTSVGDDAIDIDQSYTGTVKNYVVYVDENSDEALEIDGREDDLEGSFNLMNGTASIAKTASSDASLTADFKSKATGTVSNLLFDGGKIKLRASFAEEDPTTHKEDGAKNVIDETLVFTSTMFASSSVYADQDDFPSMVDEDENFTPTQEVLDAVDAIQTEVDAELVSATATGADDSFIGDWTETSSLLK
ncbi:right-handed parallel beta-helix repeat-containing protein [Reichenbachiella versicolor]|uniref:right-handed parallel beta-helix repeat-containing protein n=1 Tax=Reichenbachiella versicolor TaxID=1821036 RepID=UPI000D6DEE2C|nr:right-handed parallel beta-helix repeat-containing protein [Reichenbachiella versicolor]